MLKDRVGKRGTYNYKLWLRLTHDRKEARKRMRTRPDTRPSVADGWAGAEMRVFPLFNSITTDQPTDQPTDGRTDGRTKPLIELRVRN